MNKRLRILVLVLLLLCIRHMAQGQDSTKQDTAQFKVMAVKKDSLVMKPQKRNRKKQSMEIEVSGGYYANSSALTSEFFNAFYLKQFIDDDMKQRVVNRLGYSNRFGADADLGITCTFARDSLFKIKKASWFVAVREREHLDMVFSRDLFDLVFYGNKKYAGQKLDLGSFRLNQLQYQQFQIGLSRPADTANGGWSIGVSLLKGQNHFSAVVPQAEFYTSPDGRYIDLNAQYEVHASDTAHKKLAAFNGIGTSTDLGYDIPYNTFYSEGIFSVQLLDFGFIAWNSNSMHMAKDTSYHFDGINLNNIFQLKDSVLPSSNPDSVIKRNLAYTKGGYVTMLPATFSVHMTGYYGKNLSIEKGINYRMFANSRPYYYIDVAYNIRPKVQASGILAYGGYGKFNFGASLEVQFLKHYRLNIDSYYLGGYVFPKRSTGQGVTVSLTGKF